MDKREEEIKFPKDWHRAGLDPRWCFDINDKQRTHKTDSTKTENTKNKRKSKPVCR